MCQGGILCAPRALYTEIGMPPLWGGLLIVGRGEQFWAVKFGMGFVEIHDWSDRGKEWRFYS